MTPSPCATCVSDAPCPCSSYLHWWSLTNPEPSPEPTCAVCEDTDWLRLSGETFDSIAGRLGLLPASLRVHLDRHHRTDLLPKEIHA